MSARDNTLTGAAFGMTREQVTALVNLMDADGYNERPCRDAQTWDQLQPLPMSDPYPQRQAHYRDMREYTNLLRRACHACPVLAACEAYLATGPRVAGVLAGTTEEERNAWSKTA